MDIATLAGVLSGVTLLVWAIYLGGSLSAFWDIPSVMITMGGTMAATLISFPLGQVLGVMKVIKNAFISRHEEPAKVISLLVSFAEKARREGLLSLDEEAETLNDPFMKKGIQLVVDGTDPDLVRTMLETELDFIIERHTLGQSIFQTMGSLAPAFGMIGTLIGLINMLKKLNDPSAIGPGMSVALVTTFYGAILANLVFLPIAGKLKVRSMEERLLRQITIEGILSIQAGDNPRVIEEKLKSYLAPKLRNSIRKEKVREVGQGETAINPR